MNPIPTQRPVSSPMSSGRLLSCFLATLALAASLPAAAGDGSRSEQREQRQQVRIGQGVASGELTVPETRQLARQQRRIDRAQDAAGADGHVGPREAAALERMQDRSSQRIARQKRDEQERAPR